MDRDELNRCLDKASKVFELALALGSAFQQEIKGGVSSLAEEGFPKIRHKSLIDHYIEAVVDCSDFISNPSTELVSVVNKLREAGHYAVKKLQQKIKLNDPLAFLDEIDGTGFEEQSNEVAAKLSPSGIAGLRALLLHFQAHGHPGIHALRFQNGIRQEGGDALAAISELEQLDQIQAQEVGAINMANAIERLKRDKTESMSRQKREGYEAGIEWAKRFATYAQLELLSKSYSECESDTHGFEGILCSATHHNGPAGMVAETLLGDDFDSLAEEVFWEQAFGDDANKLRESVDALVGFTLGALEVFEKVD